MFGTYVESEMERDFIEFLVKEGAYTAFMRNLASNGFEKYWRNWNKLNKETNPFEWVEISFNWTRADFPYDSNSYVELTKFDVKNHDFWRNIHNKWCDLIEKPDYKY